MISSDLGLRRRIRTPQGLHSARYLSKRPSTIPEGKLNSVQRSGMRYQEQFTRMVDRKILSSNSGLLDFSRLRPKQWMRFEDELGVGHAEMDLLVSARGFNLIFELKRTFALYGLVQLGQLYAPLVQHIEDKPTFCLLVCKNLTPKVNHKFLCRTLDDWLQSVETALDQGHDLPILTLQWRP